MAQENFKIITRARVQNWRQTKFLEGKGERVVIVVYLCALCVCVLSVLLLLVHLFVRGITMNSPQATGNDDTTGRPTRLMITKMVLENFKSYAGIQEVGPFHKVMISSSPLITTTLAHTLHALFTHSKKNNNMITHTIIVILSCGGTQWEWEIQCN